LDYAPFGMLLPERTWTSDSASYRYGFNTQERDDEIYGAGNSTTADFWQYDTRLGRRWNVDPITYPWQSSYAVNNNCPIYFYDPMGLVGEESTTGGGDQTYMPPKNDNPNPMDEIMRERRQRTTPTTSGYGTGGLGSFNTTLYGSAHGPNRFIPSTFSINNTTTRTLTTTSSTNSNCTPKAATSPTTTPGTTPPTLGSNLLMNSSYTPDLSTLYTPFTPTYTLHQLGLSPASGAMRPLFLIDALDLPFMAAESTMVFAGVEEETANNIVTFGSLLLTRKIRMAAPNSGVRMHNHHIISNQVYKVFRTDLMAMGWEQNGIWNLKKLPASFHGNHPRYNAFILNEMKILKQTGNLNMNSMQNLQFKMRMMTGEAYRSGNRLNYYFK